MLSLIPSVLSLVVSKGLFVLGGAIFGVLFGRRNPSDATVLAKYAALAAKTAGSAVSSVEKKL